MHFKLAKFIVLQQLNLIVNYLSSEGDKNQKIMAVYETEALLRVQW